MKLSQVKEILKTLKTISFEFPDGSLVPEHFHVTEMGHIHKHFIDCGGTTRTENVISFQLWNANDYNHRLHPEKLVHIIELSEKKLQLPDVEIEVEYQADTIGKFGLEFNGTSFLLTTKHTDCLAKDNCGVPKPKFKWKQKQETACCTPESGCC